MQTGQIYDIPEETGKYIFEHFTLYSGEDNQGTWIGFHHYRVKHACTCHLIKGKFDCIRVIEDVYFASYYVKVI
jgi:hypothetical protein